MLIKGKLFEKAGIPLYDRLLKVASSAQKATSANIANVSTPGYKARNIDFKTEMRRFVSSQKTVIPQATDSKHISPGSPHEIIKIKEIEDTETSTGVNSVDIEKEMMDLSENQILYEFGSKKLARTFGILRTAIRGKA